MEPSERRILFARLEHHLRLRRSYSDTTLALVPMRHEISVAPAAADAYPRRRTVLAALEAENARCRQQSQCLGGKAGTAQSELR